MDPTSSPSATGEKPGLLLGLVDRRAFLYFGDTSGSIAVITLFSRAHRRSDWNQDPAAGLSVRRQGCAKEYEALFNFHHPPLLRGPEVDWKLEAEECVTHSHIQNLYPADQETSEIPVNHSDPPQVLFLCYQHFFWPQVHLLFLSGKFKVWLSDLQTIMLQSLFLHSLFV